MTRRGTAISWDMHAQATVQQIADALCEAKLPASILTGMHSRNALKRALREFATKKLIEQVTDSGNSIQFQVTDRVKLPGRIDYYRDCVVTLDLDSGRIQCDDLGVEQAVTGLFNAQFDKRSKSDITRMVQRIFDTYRADLIPLRRQGGSYFVPEEHAWLVSAVTTFVERLSGDVLALDLEQSDKTDDGLARKVADYLTHELEEFRASCDILSVDSKQFLVDRRFDKLRQSRNKLTLYAHYLKDQAERVQAQILESERHLLDAVSRTSPANESTAEGQTSPDVGSC